MSVPTSIRACFPGWGICLRQTRARLNGVTSAPLTSLLLIPGGVEFEYHQEEIGWEYSLDTDWEHLQPLVGWKSKPSSVVAVNIDPKMGLHLRDLFIQGLEGDEAEGGVLAPVAVQNVGCDTAQNQRRNGRWAKDQKVCQHRANHGADQQGRTDELATGQPQQNGRAQGKHI